MSLRLQLLAVGAVMLLLPWFAVYLVRDLEFTLRQGQLDALRSKVTAVATRIVETRDVWVPANELAQRLTPYRQAWLVPLLDRPPVLDGYFDDWDRGGRSSTSCVSLVAGDGVEECWLGQTANYVYLAISVLDDRRDYFDPASGIAQGDHIQLWIKSSGREHGLLIFSAAAGAAHVAVMDGTRRLEHRVKAHFNDEGDGFKIELRLPIEWAGERLAMAVHDGGRAGAPLTETQLRGRSAPILLQDAEVTRIFSQFHQPGARMRLLADERWLIATHGDLKQPEGLKESWFRWLLSRIIALDRLPPWMADPLCCIPTLPAGSANAVHSRWLEFQQRPVAQVFTSLDAAGSSSGLTLLVEQSSDSVDQLAGGAAGRLLGLTLLVSVSVALILLGYATLLSMRIRRLSRDVSDTVDDNGRIIGDFHASQMRDEIGDLSRSYRLLLTRTEQYTRYLESISQKLSHELRTPIAIVRSSLDNLAYSNLGDDAQVYLARAVVGLDRLSGIFNAMSSASRLEHSLRDSEKVSLDLVPLLTELVDAYRDIFSQQNIELVCPENGPLWCNGNADLIAQMLDKLLDNATDFCDENGRIVVALTTNDKIISLSVFNTGPPIPEEIRATLFDSLVSSRKESAGHYHLGLGLYMVRLIAEFHNGRVDAFNDAAQNGVVFRVDLPVSNA